METIKIEEIKRYDKVSQAGKPFVSVAIKTEDGRSISGFGNKDNQNWIVGDSVDVEIEQKGQYLNFTVPKGSLQKGGTAPDVNRVEMKIDALRAEVSTLGATLTGMRGVLGDILSKLPKNDDEPPF